LLLPTLVQTKVVWYLNPFYPLFAILVGSTLANVAFNGHLSATRRPLMLAGVLIVAAVTSAQARSMWRIHVVTNLNTSVQGVLLAKRARFYGSRVSRDRLQRGEAFVVRAMMRGTFRVMSDASQDGRPMHADLLILSQQVHDDRLRPVGSADGHFLYEPAD
jgi:hypothetical protein